MERLYYQTATIPAGTPVTAPVTVAWPLEDNQLVEVTIEIPDGHCGLTGVRVLWAQQQIVPFANNSYLVGNDRTFNYPFADYITSSGLVIAGYNTDIFAHTFYLTALITNLPEPGENAEAEVVTPGQYGDLSLLPPDDLNVGTILNTPTTPTEPVTPLPPSPPTIGKIPITRPPSPYQEKILAERKRKADMANR